MRNLAGILFLLSLASAGQDVNWTAQWIMHPTVQPQEHAVIIFRKNFDLPSKPGSFLVYLSAITITDFL